MRQDPVGEPAATDARNRAIDQTSFDPIQVNMHRATRLVLDTPPMIETPLSSDIDCSPV
jgi:hypothetical protein